MITAEKIGMAICLSGLLLWLPALRIIPHTFWYAMTGEQLFTLTSPDQIGASILCLLLSFPVLAFAAFVANQD